MYPLLPSEVNLYNIIFHEVSAIYSNLCTLTMTRVDAVKAYYSSMANVNRLKANGKYKEKVMKQRKKNRMSNVSFTLLHHHSLCEYFFLLYRN